MNKKSGRSGSRSSKDENKSKHKELSISSDEDDKRRCSEEFSPEDFELQSESSSSLSEDCKKNKKKVKDNKVESKEECKELPKPKENIKSSNNKVEQVVCDICYKTIQIQGVIESCNHKFCFDCIKRWSRIENTCPMCKKRFNSLKRKLILPENELPKTDINVEDKETIEIPDISQSDARHTNGVDELLNFLILARNAQRFTRVGRLLEEIALFSYENFFIIEERPVERQEEESSLENFLELSESFDNEQH